jgi:hypothetical protein
MQCPYIFIIFASTFGRNVFFISSPTHFAQESIISKSVNCLVVVINIIFLIRRRMLFIAGKAV